MKTAIVWFRNDLRLKDNYALAAALDSHQCIIPVYIYNPDHYTNSSHGFPRIGSLRAHFISECVDDLSKNIQQKGSKLIILAGRPEDLIPALCTRHQVSAVFASKEVAPYEVREEDRLADALAAINIDLRLQDNTTLTPRGDLPFSIQAMPDMFTAFRWEVEKKCSIHKPLPEPDNIPSPGIEAIEMHTPADPIFIGAASTDARAVVPFKGGETEALKRLRHYLWDTDAASTYYDTRNGLTGADYSTKFSPWLSAGCLSARTIYYEVKLYERQRTKNKSTYWIGFELLWRDFFRYNMEKYHCELFFMRGPKRKSVSYTADTAVLQKWIDGETGNDFIDANMLELKHTGFMSNRGRQCVASYLVNDLEQPWLAGAAWFESQLIDYDVCSNYGNWAYIAGVGNDPRPDRYFNITKQAATYDPDGIYRELWLGQREAMEAGNTHSKII